MKKIYVVTQGEYSDYRIVAICSTEDKAKIMRRHQKGDIYAHERARIETFVLDKEADLAARGYWFWTIGMERDGTVSRCQKGSISNRNRGIGEARTSFVKALTNNAGEKMKSYLWCEFYAKTEKQAIKIVNDRRRQAIAGNKWPADKWDPKEVKRKKAEWKKREDEADAHYRKHPPPVLKLAGFTYASTKMPKLEGE